MMNKIWASFIVLGIIYAFFTGRLDLINTEILNCTKESFDVVLKIFPVMALWLGIMNIASTSGLMKQMAKKLTPFLSKIFPEIPKGHESLSLIASNLIINMFGLGSAATPFGLKAMKSLQELNSNKKEASRSMITFLVMNTAGVTLIPTTVISLRMAYGSSNPTETLLASIIVTVTSFIFALLIDLFFARRHHD